MFSNVLGNIGSIGLVIYVVSLILLVDESDKTKKLLSKVFNPPSFFPSWIIFCSPLLFFLIVLMGGSSSWVGIPFIIAGIGANILQSNQTNKLKKLQQYQHSETYVHENISIKHDPFKKSYSFYGPNIFCQTSIGEIRCDCVAFGSAKENGVLLLTGTFNHKYNFSQEAYDNHGNKIYLATHINETLNSYVTSHSDPDRKITNKNGDVIGTIEGQTRYETNYYTSYSETFGIDMNLEQAKRIEEGYQIKLYGDKEIIIDIPRWYILAFVKGIENKPEFNKINWQ